MLLRTVQIGGLTKGELLERLAAAGVELNEAARALFASDAFTTLPTRTEIRTAEVTVRELGLQSGATMSEIRACAALRELLPAPIELGPHLRLQLLDEPEEPAGAPMSQHRAPPGSITVVSEPLSEEPSLPGGFYLRRSGDTRWLRGYWCDGDHVWDPQDRLLFARP